MSEKISLDSSELKKLIICDIANEVQIYALKIKWQKIM